MISKSTIQGDIMTMKKGVLKNTVRTFSNRFAQVYCFGKHYIHGAKLNMSAEEARLHLEAFSPNPKTSCYKQDTPVRAGEKYDCAVIIPTYNCARYIVSCVESVLKANTKYNIRIIIINDGSTDETRNLLKRYEGRNDCIVIHQDNKGFSGARNTGLDIANGKYIMFVDADDQLCGHAIDALLDDAFAHDADVVGSNYMTVTPEGTKIQEFRKHIRQKIDPTGGALSGMPWSKVYKSELFEHLRFPERYWYEDSINAQIVWPLSKTVYTIPDITYAYTQNPLGISQTSIHSPKAIDSLYITEALFHDKPYFGLKLDAKAFSYFLRMVRLTYKRTCRCNTEIAKSIFCVQCELYQKFRDVKPDSDAYRDIEAALQTRNFRKYLKAVAF